MRKLLLGLGVLVILFLGLVFVLPSLIPSETYKARIQEQLSAELGRDVQLSGDVRLSTFPVIKATTGGVRIANAPDFTDADFASLDSLEARIRLLPLLSRRVEISRFTLKSPVISLEKRADGQTNWSFSDDRETTETSTDGPFRRDGRFTDIDPNIQAFTIENGTLRFVDQVTEQSLTVDQINTFLSLPGLAEALRVEGDMQVDGRPLTIDLRMDSPEAFLSGQSANLVTDLSTDGARLSLEGNIPAGETIAFQGNVDADLADMNAFQTAFGQWLPEIDGLDALQTAALSGTLDYSETRIALMDAGITVSGPALNGQFDGDASVIDGSPVLNGRLDVDISDAQALAPLLPEPVPGFEALKTATLTTDLNAESETAFSITNARARFAGPNFETTFNGSGRYAEALALDGDFNANISDARALLREAKLELDPTLIEDSAIAGAITANGKLSIDGTKATLSDVTATTESDVQTTKFTGQISYDETASVNGVLNTAIPSLSDLNAALSMKIPYESAIGRIAVDTNLSGSAADLTLEGLSARMENGALNGTYTGTAKISETAGVTLAGELSANGDSLRRLAEINGTDLPPSTDMGPIFEAFNLRGKVGGTATDIKLTGATVGLDQINGNGDFGVDLSGERPRLTGALEMGALDLRPYMEAYSAQRPTGQIQPWSEEPLPVDPLRAFDASLDLKAASIQAPRLSMAETSLNVLLQEGRLTATFPSLKLYGGAGQATLIYDVTQSVPQFTANAGLVAVESEGFLGAVAGFTQATGKAETNIELTSSGRSQAELMRSLSGTGLYQLANGTLKGIDAAEFLTGLDTALQSRALPAGIGPSYSTAVQDLLGGVQIENGVATIDQFTLQGLGVSAEASGQVDLGAQTIDFRFRPKSTAESASGLAAFGIPLRFSGSFGSASASLDTDFLGEIVEAKARAEAQKLISDRVGGSAGQIVGSLLGNQPSSSEDAQVPESETSPSNQINQIVGGLLGRNNAQPDPADTSEQTEQQPEDNETKEDEEESVEDAVLGLFGIKRDE